MDPSVSSAQIRAHRIAEWFWLAAIVVALVAAVHAIYTEGWEAGRTVLIIPAVASVWYGFRRRFRKRLEKQQG